MDDEWIVNQRHYCALDGDGDAGQLISSALLRIAQREDLDAKKCVQVIHLVHFFSLSVLFNIP